MKFASFTLTLIALLSKGASASTFSDGKNIRGKVEDQGIEQRVLQKGSSIPCKPKDENDTGLQHMPDQERLPKVVGGKVECINNIIQASGRQYPCDNVDLLSFLPLTDLENSDFSFADANDIWGWTDPLDNVEYAIIGLTTGTSFVSLEDPENPVVLGKLPTATSSSLWRDIKVYDNYAYIVSEASGHGLQIFDLTQLRTTTSFTTFSATATENGFGNAHNIFINEDSAKAYVVGSSTCGGGLRVYDISSPLQPSLEWCYNEKGYTHDVQCVVYSGPDVNYQGKEICFASNEGEVDIICMDCDNEQFLSTTSTSNPQYIHQGWLSEDQRYFFVNDELDELRGYVSKTHTYVFDVSNLNNPSLHYTYVGDVNSIDHNNYVKGNFLYQANYRHGLRVLEGTDNPSSSNPLTEVSYFDIHPESDGTQFNGAWSNFPYYNSGVVVVSSIERGLYVLKPNLGEDPPTPPTTSTPSMSPSNKPPSGPSGPWEIELSEASPPITTTIDGQMYLVTTYEATDKDYDVQVFDSTCSGDPITLFNEVVSDSPLSSGFLDIEIEARLEIDIDAIQSNPDIYTDFGSGSGVAEFCVEGALYQGGTKVVKHRAVFSADVSVVEGFFTLSNVELFGENPTENNDIDIGYSGSVNVYLCDYDTMDEDFDTSALGPGDELTVCVENSDPASDSIIESIWQMDMEGFANGLSANFDVITDGEEASGNSDLIEYKCDSVLGKCAVSVVVVQAFFQQGTETSLDVSGDAILGSGLSKNNDEENSFSLSLKLDGGCSGGGFLRSIMNGVFKG